ncbi:ATP-binding protein [Proteus mirabilis]|uniref:ATP-binding protein n=1 Tax=Proteus mirabilis TaxID=584 RepID=A0A379GHT0_PROMI|nr:ATP-binding protein [Proteus mirabilis]
MKRLQNELTALINRGVDRHLRLAVTGLSRSGKTAFITSLVNQLTNVHSGRVYLYFLRHATNSY